MLFFISLKDLTRIIIKMDYDKCFIINNNAHDFRLENRRGTLLNSDSAKTAAIPRIYENGVLKLDAATSPPVFSPDLPKKSVKFESEEEEIIVPIVEALNRIIQIKGTDEDERSNDISLGLNTSYSSSISPK